MGDFTPIHKPGQAVTMTVTATVTGGQLVDVVGDYQAAPAAAGSAKVVGQASRDAVAGELIAIHMPSKTITEATASGALVAGDHVKSAAGGKITKFTVGTDPETQRIGLVIKGASDGQPARYQPA